MIGSYICPVQAVIDNVVLVASCVQEVHIINCQSLFCPGGDCGIPGSITLGCCSPLELDDLYQDIACQASTDDLCQGIACQMSVTDLYQNIACQALTYDLYQGIAGQVSVTDLCQASAKHPVMTWCERLLVRYQSMIYIKTLHVRHQSGRHDIMSALHIACRKMLHTVSVTNERYSISAEKCRH